MNNKHQAGFVNIIGRPNVGKSTLMNALVGERMSIITHKPQTTRHRIIGILSGEDFQMVFSDTPGIIEQPSYKMQEAMNRFVFSSLEDADVLLWVIDPKEQFEQHGKLIQQLGRLNIPIFLILNKMDTTDPNFWESRLPQWENTGIFQKILPISALYKTGTDQLLKAILEKLPICPPYYPKDQLTDKPERFFTSEIIREKILLFYHQEIPYSTEVVVESFKEGNTKSGLPLLSIAATIFVSRKTQKSILIGKQGEAIKKLGSAARKDLESFFEQKVFLELHVKV
ncbi:MAG: hypothetical protein RLZZ248_1526, partial [Bacteroidota bacterium]